MADDITLPGDGSAVSTDEIAGKHFQRIKLTLGDDNVNDGTVSASNPVPVNDSTLYDLVETLRDLNNFLSVFGIVRGVDGALRVNSITGSTVAVSSLPTLATVTTVGTLTTLSNQTSLGGFLASALVQNQMNLVAQQSNIVNMVG